MARSGTRDWESRISRRSCSSKRPRTSMARVSTSRIGRVRSAMQQAAVPGRDRLAHEAHRDAREPQEGPEGKPGLPVAATEGDEGQPHHGTREAGDEYDEQHLVPAEEGADHRGHLPIPSSQPLASARTTIDPGDEPEREVATGGTDGRVQGSGRPRQEAGGETDGDA